MARVLLLKRLPHQVPVSYPQLLKPMHLPLKHHYLARQQALIQSLAQELKQDRYLSTITQHLS